MDILSPPPQPLPLRVGRGRRRAAALSAAVILSTIALTACSGAGTSSTGASSSATSSPGAAGASGASAAPAAPSATSTKVWTQVFAQGQLVTMAAPVLVDLAAFQALSTSTPLAKYQEVATKTAADETVLHAKLSQGQWPAASSQAIQALASAVSDEAGFFQKLSSATSLKQVSADLAGGASISAALNKASVAARAALGLSTAN
jgi:hypothetical protein